MPTFKKLSSYKILRLFLDVFNKNALDREYQCKLMEEIIKDYD